MKVLLIDIGGTSVKLMASGHEGFKKFPAGRGLTPAKLCKAVIAATEGWDYEAITLGYPGLVRSGKVARNPCHLGKGWAGFDFEEALKCPVRTINDAAMQALSVYETGRLLILSLGTSVGAAVIADDVVVPIEIGVMPLSKSEALMDRLSKEALQERGKRRWQKSVSRAVKLLRDIFVPDRFRLCGANAKHLVEIPEGCEREEYETSFVGAVRLWPGADMLAEAHETTWHITRKKA